MDSIIKFLQSIFGYVYNFQASDANGLPVTQIVGAQSRSDIGIPTNSLSDIVVTVNGNNTCSVTYGNENILGIIAVPDAKDLIEQFLNEKIVEEFISFESEKPKDLAISPASITPIEAKLDTQELNFLREVYAKGMGEGAGSGGSKWKIPNRVKLINPVKPVNPSKPINPVRKIKPWRSIPRPKTEE